MVSVNGSGRDCSIDKIEGQSETTKGTPIDAFKGLQGDSPTAWDDTVLDRLDGFMAKAHGYGIKLLISIHSYNALESNRDFYGKWYGTGDFYTNSEAIAHFKDRIARVLAHVNPNNGKTWAQSSEYIFAFEAQNEAMHPQVRLLELYTDRLDLTSHRVTPQLLHPGSAPWRNP
jgi:mannan endo-1,4-beta-mannosidase